MPPGISDFSLLLPQKRRGYTREDPLHLRHKDTVIGDGNTGILADADAVEHFSGIQHTATTVYHQIEGGEIIRE